MAKTFRNALLEQMEATKTPLKEVAARSGVSYEQLKKVKQREDASTNVDDARKIANAFGLTLDEFLDDRTIEARIEVVELYSRLSPDARRILQAASDAPPAQDQKPE
jgi:transcriptional regulator with XRE-family HTH domain